MILATIIVVIVVAISVYAQHKLISERMDYKRHQEQKMYRQIQQINETLKEKE